MHCNMANAVMISFKHATGYYYCTRMLISWPFVHFIYSNGRKGTSVFYPHSKTRRGY